jgi:DNA repair exonuclease SbcCD nuclease subunit
VLHGEVQGMLPAGAQDGDRAAVEIPNEEIGVDAWDYIALGHYHVYRELAPNMFYSGSIDYTSTNPWGEMVEERAAGVDGKCFAEHDLVTGEQTIHRLPASRPLVDLPTLDGYGLSIEDLDAALRATIEACPGCIDDKVVRLVVRNVTKDVARGLDHRAIKEYKRRALFLNLDIRRPNEVRTAQGETAPVRKRQSIDEMISTILDGRFELAPDVDKNEFLTRAQAYLDATYEGTPDEADEVSA